MLDSDGATIIESEIDGGKSGEILARAFYTLREAGSDAAYSVMITIERAKVEYVLRLGNAVAVGFCSTAEIGAMLPFISAEHERGYALARESLLEQLGSRQ